MYLLLYIYFYYAVVIIFMYVYINLTRYTIYEGGQEPKIPKLHYSFLFFVWIEFKILKFLTKSKFVYSSS